MMIISSGDVMRASVVMQAGLKRNMSIHAIVELFKKAADKLYTAKSFIEQEMALGLLFLHLGGAWCRQENGSMHIPPMETSFSHWNMSLLSQVENPIIGRIFAGNPNIWFFRCLPNRDVISS